MHLISGWAWFLPVYGVVILFLVRLLVDRFLGETYYPGHLWPKILVLGLICLFCIWVGYRKNIKRKILVIDADSGETIGSAPSKHQFLFAPIQYWAVLLPIMFVISFYYTEFWQTCRLPLLCR